MNRYLLSFSCLFLLACTNEETPLTDPIEDRKIYTVEVAFNWRAEQLPSSIGEFPDGAHFSPVIGAIHTEGNGFFEKGGSSTAGMEAMAETGATTILSQEIEAQVATREALTLFEAQAGSTATQAVEITDINAQDEFVFLSLVSMIAPSPDWFVALQNIPLKDANGNWLDRIEVPLRNLDAGTDSGAVFTAANLNTDPKGRIEAFADGVSLGKVVIRKQ